MRTFQGSSVKVRESTLWRFHFCPKSHFLSEGEKSEQEKRAKWRRLRENRGNNVENPRRRQSIWVLKVDDKQIANAFSYARRKPIRPTFYSPPNIINIRKANIFGVDFAAFRGDIYICFNLLFFFSIFIHISIVHTTQHMHSTVFDDNVEHFDSEQWLGGKKPLQSKQMSKAVFTINKSHVILINLNGKYGGEL